MTPFHSTASVRRRHRRPGSCSRRTGHRPRDVDSHAGVSLPFFSGPGDQRIPAGIGADIVATHIPRSPVNFPKNAADPRRWPSRAGQRETWCFSSLPPGFGVIVVIIRRKPAEPRLLGVRLLRLRFGRVHLERGQDLDPEREDGRLKLGDRVRYRTTAGRVVAPEVQDRGVDLSPVAGRASQASTAVSD
jgi:hypothetical protein